MIKENKKYTNSHNNNGDYMKSYIKDNIIYIYILFFLTISYLSIFETSRYLSPTLGILYYKQIIWYLIGLIIIFIIKRININMIYKFSIFLYIINIILLIGLFFFGSEINNSKAWYNIFGFSFQPSEFMKISLILLDAEIINKYYKKKDKISKKEEIKIIIILFLLFTIPSILTFLEPDTGSVIGYFIITISMIYISNIDKKWLLGLFISFLIILFIFLYIYFNYQDLFINIFGSSFFYRIDRIINWQSKSGLQLNNSLIAIGSSGLTGNNYIPIYYPELETDFIFTSFTSTYGFIGGLLLIILSFSFDLYVLNLIKKEPNKQNKYVLFGISMLFLYQQIQSIGMTLGILPITGITLPLISYGGSSLISYLILTGLIINITKKKKC